MEASGIAVLGAEAPASWADETEEEASEGRHGATIDHKRAGKSTEETLERHVSSDQSHRRDPSISGHAAYIAPEATFDEGNALDQALLYGNLGWRVVPTDGRLKHPTIPSWQKLASSDPRRIRELFETYPSRDVAIVTGQESGIFVLDVDPRHGGVESLEDLEERYGKLPETPMSITGSQGFHFLFKYPVDEDIRNSAGNILGPGLDIRGNGGQISAPPTIHPNGCQYAWEFSAHPGEIPVADAPPWLLELLKSHPEAPRKEKTVRVDGSMLPGDRFNAEHEWPDLLEEVGATFVHGRDGMEFWARPRMEGEMGYIPHTSASLYYQGSDVLKVFTSHWAPLEEGQTYDKLGFWAEYNFEGTHDEKVAKAVACLAQRQLAEEWDPWFDELKANCAALQPSKTSSNPTLVSPTPPSQTDDGNARLLVDTHVDDMRYVDEWSRWLIWDNGWWKPDKRRTVHNWAREVARNIYNEGFDNPELRRWAIHTNSSSGLAAMEKEARNDPRVSVVVDELDVHHDLLAVENGTIDLRTGQLLRARRDDLITKGCDFVYDEKAVCPIFDRFVQEILPDQAVRDFVQRALGYSLTGHTREQCVFFAYGGGANGKSTLLGVIQDVLREMATPAPQGFLTAKTVAQHDIARLHGMRLVVASETSQGTLNEPRLKEITGGDRLEGSHKYSHHFSFTPTHTLWILGNHKPRIEGTDDGIWRRLHLIPFTEQIPAAKRDTHLAEKLRNELPGILAWLVRGAVDWYNAGLRPPVPVTSATEAYRKSEDVFGQFTDECLRFGQGQGFRATTTQMNERVATWCSQNDFEPLSPRTIKQRLMDRGLDEPKMSNGKRWWDGVHVLLDEADSTGTLLR